MHREFVKLDTLHPAIAVKRILIELAAAQLICGLIGAGIPTLNFLPVKNIRNLRNETQINKMNEVSMNKSIVKNIRHIIEYKGIYS